MVERTRKFASLRAPDARDLEPMKLWLRLTEPLSKKERDHLLGGTDFVALVEKQEESWLHKIMEQAVSKWFPKDVSSLSFFAMSDFIDCARASLLRRSNAVLATIQGFVCAANNALMY